MIPPGRPQQQSYGRYLPGEGAGNVAPLPQAGSSRGQLTSSQDAENRARFIGPFAASYERALGTRGRLPAPSHTDSLRTDLRYPQVLQSAHATPVPSQTSVGVPRSYGHLAGPSDASSSTTGPGTAASGRAGAERHWTHRATSPTFSGLTVTTSGHSEKRERSDSPDASSRQRQRTMHGGYAYLSSASSPPPGRGRSFAGPSGEQQQSPTVATAHEARVTNTNQPLRRSARVTTRPLNYYTGQSGNDSSHRKSPPRNR
jgi:hypothetical protein